MKGRMKERKEDSKNNGVPASCSVATVRVVPCWTVFYRVLPSFTEFLERGRGSDFLKMKSVLPRMFTEFYPILPSFS